MVDIVAGADGDFTISLTPKELQTLKRKASETSVKPEVLVKTAVGVQLTIWANDYQRVDAPGILSAYNALEPPVQAQVNALLGL